MEYWKKENVFRKSVENRRDAPYFSFYDGPPFATGLPHYGHILAGTLKDVIPRYQTMRGKKVSRKWGWDCHGLPIENLVEEELGLKTKQDIVSYGIKRFNQKARDSVLLYEKEWKETIPRTGRWVDMKNDYKTMDPAYSESVWWVFKTLYDKGLIYEGFKSMHICPRCETTLSNFEVNLGYEDIKDISVTVRFRLKDEEGTSILAWTTTPWTLPGNMAVGVHPNIKYVKVFSAGENFILAKDRLDVMPEDYEILEEFEGQELIGRKYHPPFDYYLDANIENKENAWKVYGARYVSTDSGTGIVHLAPAYGEEDMELAQKSGIPLVHHVAFDGTFKPEVEDFAGKHVKPKGDHMSTDIAIIKLLVSRNLLFAKEKITHSYPHCWRCDTPLLNYATSSWFVSVQKIKNKMIAANKRTSWVPKEIRAGRFGKWLEGAKDWAISRSRFWGAPLPVWQSESGAVEVIGSIEEIKEKSRGTNKYFVMRHGEAESNIQGIVSAKKDAPHNLTSKGRDEVETSAEKIKKEKVSVIIASPFVRTSETAFLVAVKLGLSKESVIFDDRLGELNAGEFHGKSWADYYDYFSSPDEKLEKSPPGGETVLDMKRRIGEFLYEMDRKYEGENILFVTHGLSTLLLFAVAKGADKKEVLAMEEAGFHQRTAEVRKLLFAPIPHNDDFDLDLHRPYIDDFIYKSKQGEEMKRIPEVFDTWFESGSMPYGQQHHPHNLQKFNPLKKKGFPADFIAEGLDQTRGWFYSLLVLGIGLYGLSPYKNVIVNGLILAEDGKKMSKRLKNYPDPVTILNTYGADALRYYLLASPAVKAEELRFSEKGINEVVRKVLLRLQNVLSFYSLYADNDTSVEVLQNELPQNILDRWIISRLHLLNKEVTSALESYELDKATKPVGEFIDDLSTWYVRRSRDRFKVDSEDKKQALATTLLVLRELSKIIAPTMPFFAEYLYQKVKTTKDPESVHLEDWPSVGKIETKVLEEMDRARTAISLGLEARAGLGIKVRQPLSCLRTDIAVSEPYQKLIRDEVNVKKYEVSKDGSVFLDSEISDDLKREGNLREFIRQIQDIRKKEKFTPKDQALLQVETDSVGRSFVEDFEKEMQEATLISSVSFEKIPPNFNGREIFVGDMKFLVRLDKA